MTDVWIAEVLAASTERLREARRKFMTAERARQKSLRSISDPAVRRCAASLFPDVYNEEG